MINELRISNYTEIDIENTFLDIKLGFSIRRAAKKYRIPYATLRGRNNGNRSIRNSKRDKQILSPTQESHLKS